MYYVGYTNNYQRRLRQHNESEKNTYTSKHRPWFIKAIFECRNNEADAIRLEKFIKKQKSKIFLQRFIDSETSELTGKLARLVYPEFSGRNFGVILRVVGSSPLIHPKKSWTNVWNFLFNKCSWYHQVILNISGRYFAIHPIYKTFVN